jgi:hypothetical protein
MPAATQTLAFWRDPHGYLERSRRRYGTRFTIDAVGMAPLVFMFDPAEIKAIVTAPATLLHPGAGAQSIEPLVGARSFMLAEEDEHLRGRRAVLPAFSYRAVHEHANVVRDIVAREVADWPRDVPLAILPRLRVLTLRVILRTVFGREDARLAELHTRLLKMLSVVASLALQEPQLRQLPPWRGIWRRFTAERAEVDRILTQLIEDEADRREHEHALVCRLLDRPCANEARASTAQVRDDLMSVILAGHETTASELAWAFQLLAHDPRVTRRLVEELDGGGEDYLTATVQEVLRHRPVFLFTIPRVAQAPVEVGGATYRPPVQLLGCIHLTHHDARVYDEPQRFWPERFVGVAPRLDAWVPWGGGRKRCPGLHLATLEMRTVLETVLREVELVPVGRAIERARWRSVIVTPERGSRVVLRRRGGFSRALGRQRPVWS